ncbi:uncharacterized protein LOC131845308 isoform X1 [Achroia grisella]|uniref:uncharacterized protein LOC131845308 isoform X1 n=1 Tax=Achroia grisella TaxID=688607 RepID=UPI0027D23CB8|nr:uncharacterized protein LOC131845308 isoform X1 [Achroia grisella]
MGEIDINIEGYNVNGICVGCLNYNRKMFYSEEIKICFKIIANIDVPDGLSIQVCWECLAAVKAVGRFQAQILKSYDVLIEYSKQHTFLNSPVDITAFATTQLTVGVLDNISIEQSSTSEPDNDFNMDVDLKLEDKAFQDDPDFILKEEEYIEESHFSDNLSQEQDGTSDDDVQLSQLKTEKTRKKEKREKKGRKMKSKKEPVTLSKISKRSKYKEGYMEKALDSVKKLRYSYYKQQRDTKKLRALGQTRCEALQVFSNEEEKIVVDWITEQRKRGFPRKKDDVKSFIVQLLNDLPRPNPFPENIPGDDWIEDFEKRHPILTQIPKSQDAEAEVKQWFENVNSYINTNNLKKVIRDPKRLFIIDETNFNISPKISLCNYDKSLDATTALVENFTVMFTFSANGFCCNPYLVYPFKNITRKLTNWMPVQWISNNSDNGLITATCFLEYLSELYAQLKRVAITFPIILFVDGRVPLNIDITNLCKKFDIHLVAFYPYADKIINIDEATYRPIIKAWMEMSKLKVSDYNFAPQMHKSLLKSLDKATLIERFKVLGLFPFRHSKINYKCLKTIVRDEEIHEENDSERSIVIDEIYLGTGGVTVEELPSNTAVSKTGITNNKEYVLLRNPMSDSENNLGNGKSLLYITANNGQVPETAFDKNTNMEHSLNDTQSILRTTLKNIQICKTGMRIVTPLKPLDEKEDVLKKLVVEEANLKNVDFNIPSTSTAILISNTNNNMTEKKSLQVKSPSKFTRQINNNDFDNIEYLEDEEFDIVSSVSSNENICVVCEEHSEADILNCVNCKGKYHRDCVPGHHQMHIPDSQDGTFLCHNCSDVNSDSSESGVYLIVN